LGIIQDYSYGEDLDVYIEENKRNSSLISIATGDNALETLIKQLNGGRIDVMIEDKLVAQFNIASLGYADNLKTIAVVSDPEQLWIGFSPANPKSGEYARILSEGMIKFRNDGRLKTILDKYGLSDWK
jgi:polar amino acid transport system substrate-binding protein